MTEPRRDRLDQPREPGRVRLPRFDPEAFGRWSESIARYMGTAKFIVYMTVVIAAWFLWNTLAPGRLNHHVLAPLGGEWADGLIEGT